MGSGKEMRGGISVKHVEGEGWEKLPPCTLTMNLPKLG